MPTDDSRTTHQQRRYLHHQRADHRAQRASRIIIHHQPHQQPQAQIGGRFYTLSNSSYLRLYRLADHFRPEGTDYEIWYF